MTQKELLLPCLFFFLSLSPFAQAQQTIVAASRSIDWSQAGVIGGIPNRSTICSSLNPGATAEQINGAIASCPSGQVVKLNAGTYNLSTGLIFNGKSNVTLRGAGADQTFLIFTGSNSCGGINAAVCFMGNSGWEGNFSGGPVNWTAGYAKGVTQLTLSSVSGITAGTLLILDQLDDDSDSGGVLVCDTIGVCRQTSESGSPGRTNRHQQQEVQVTAVNGSVVTISPAVQMPNWRSSRSPQAWWTGTQDQLDGVEDLSIDNQNSSGDTGFGFHNAYNCWLKGVRSLNGKRNHVWFQLAARIQVQDSYFYGTQNAASQSYGVESFMSSDCLVVNNIFQHITTPMMIGPTSGSVYAYNYSTDNFYNVAAWQMAQLNFHDAGIGMVLIEGNDGQGFEADTFHGTANLGTAFRNVWSGVEGSKTLNTVPLQIMSHQRYFNIVGNVVGKSAYHTHYEDAAPSGTNGNTSIFVIGWGRQTGGTAPDVRDDPLVKTTMFRWGNYDVVNGSAQWNASEVPSGLSQLSNPVPSDHSLPASFYLTSKPRWWGTMPWPAIGPDVTGGQDPTGHAYKIPAHVCYDNTPQTNGILNFNGSACYPSGGPNPPTAPTNLRIVR